MGDAMSQNGKELSESLNGKTPTEVVEWALARAKTPVVTTNFRPYEASILHLVTRTSADINVIWCDTGYNTYKTYVHADALIESLGLNIKLYVPEQTTAHRDFRLGIPDVDDPKHAQFTEEVKLEPFRRAMLEHQPDVWFTNLRKGQTAFRDGIDIISFSKDGKMKVSPFYHYSDDELDAYLEKHNLPNELAYFDPTKALSNRECGLHN